MTQKNFEFDDELAAFFEASCRRLLLIEKRVGAAAVLFFFEQDAETRERILLRYAEWLKHEDLPPAGHTETDADDVKPSEAGSKGSPAGTVHKPASQKGKRSAQS